MKGWIAVAVAMVGLVLILSMPAVAQNNGNCDVNNPPPIGGGPPPEDTDNDCEYEDINGDNLIDVFDVQALFQNMFTNKVQNHAEGYDFSDVSAHTRVTIFDIGALWLEHIYYG